MRVKRTIIKEVYICPECPFYVYHPHENECIKLHELGYRAYDTMVPRDRIDDRCPFKGNK